MNRSHFCLYNISSYLLWYESGYSLISAGPAQATWEGIAPSRLSGHRDLGEFADKREFSASYIPKPESYSQFWQSRDLIMTNFPYRRHLHFTVVSGHRVFREARGGYSCSVTICLQYPTMYRCQVRSCLLVQRYVNNLRVRLLFFLF